jgi:hypothetical protein
MVAHALGQRRPEPLGCTLQAREGVGLADRTVLDRAEQGKQLIERPLPAP